MRKIVALSIFLLSVLVVGLVINNFFNSYSASLNSASTATDASLSTPLPNVNADIKTPADSNPVGTSSANLGAITVPDDFTTINQAVANASDGQTILVKAGTYNESVNIDKSLTLIGENQTVIDAHSVGADMLICHNGVNVTGFTMQNTPTPGTGTFIEQMEGIGLSVQLPDIQIVGSSDCNISANNLAYALSGVCLERSSQNNIKGNRFGNFSDGFLTESGFEMQGNGVQINNSSDNRIENNIFVACGLCVENFSNSNTITGNIFNDAGSAIALVSSSDNMLRNNTLVHNFYSFEVTGSDTSAFINNVDSSNTIDGKPIYYLIGQANQIVPSDAACIVLVNCINMTIQNPTLALSYNGVVLANTTDSIVSGCKLGYVDPAFLNQYATPLPPLDIMLFSSYYDNVQNNQVTICLDYSSFNCLNGNTGVLHLYDSNNNKIINNLLKEMGCFGSADSDAVTVEASSNNVLNGNTITGIATGVAILSGSTNNTIISNNIVNSPEGGITISDDFSDIFGSSNLCDPNRPIDNIIYNNTITGNGNQGILDCGYCTKIIGNNLPKNMGWGIVLSNSVNSTVMGNAIEGFVFGQIGTNVTDALIVANNITANSRYSQYGIWFLSNSSGTFYDNNFLSTITFKNQVPQIWDNGVQGNYWSSYNGVDANGDSVGDTPYLISSSNTDNYPLMIPYNICQAILAVVS